MFWNKNSGDIHPDVSGLGLDFKEPKQGVNFTLGFFVLFLCIKSIL